MNDSQCLVRRELRLHGSMGFPFQCQWSEYLWMLNCSLSVYKCIWHTLGMSCLHLEVILFLRVSIEPFTALKRASRLRCWKWWYMSLHSVLNWSTSAKTAIVQDTLVQSIIFTLLELAHFRCVTFIYTRENSRLTKHQEQLSHSILRLLAQRLKHQSLFFRTELVSIAVQWARSVHCTVIYYTLASAMNCSVVNVTAGGRFSRDKELILSNRAKIWYSYMSIT